MKKISEKLLGRVNIKNIENAIKTYMLLKKRGYKVDLAISSDKIVMVDADVTDIPKEVIESRTWYKDYRIKKKLAILKEILTVFAKEYETPIKIYKTPHGFHAIFLKKFNKHRWRRIYLELYEIAIRYDIFDALHIKATLQRDYTTLRLNQAECLIEINANGEWYPCQERKK